MPERPPTILEAYDRYIAYIRHENELIHQRTTWFIAFQTLVTVGFGYLVNKGMDQLWDAVAAPSEETLTAALKVMLQLLPCAVTGAVSAIAARTSVRAAVHSQMELDKTWKSRFHTVAEAAGLPPLMGGGDGKAKGEGYMWAKALIRLASVGWLFISAALIILIFSQASLVWETLGQGNALLFYLLPASVGIIFGLYWIIAYGKDARIAD